jgi:hypothetical protein
LTQPAGKARLDQAPADREIAVSAGQRPDRVQMVRQHHNGVDDKRMPPSRAAECRTQQFDVLGEQPQPALGQVRRK